jgi:hypothetical protein
LLSHSILISLDGSAQSMMLLEFMFLMHCDTTACVPIHRHALTSVVLCCAMSRPADGAPVVPISAQLKYNVDVVCEFIEKRIPVPVRDFVSPPQMIVIRWGYRSVVFALIRLERRAAMHHVAVIFAPCDVMKSICYRCVTASFAGSCVC